MIFKGEILIIKDFNLTIRPEDEVLILCSRTKINVEMENRILDLISSNFDWNYLIEKASFHFLRPLLCQNIKLICPEKVPSRVLNDLNRFFQNNIFKNLLLLGELTKIMELLEKSGIPSLTYKGPILAYQCYGNIAYRQFGDIDILINKNDALNAKNVMIASEYQFYEYNSPNHSTYMKLNSEFKFTNDKHVLIEINWNFAGMLFSFRNSTDILFEELEEVEINGNKFFTFSPLNQILVLSIHCAKHDWKRLSWICDISEYIRNQNVDWNELIEKSEILGIKRILFINLYLAKELFGLVIPKEMEVELYNPIIVNISQKIIRWIFFDQKESLNFKEKLYLYIKRRELLSDKVYEFLNIIKTPVYGDYKTLPLPDILFFFYYIIHPFFLFKRVLFNK